MLVIPILKLPRSHTYIEGFGVFDCCFVNHGGYTAVAIQRAFVRINTAHWTLGGYNHTLVFSVSPHILVLSSKDQVPVNVLNDCLPGHRFRSRKSRLQLIPQVFA